MLKRFSALVLVLALLLALAPQLGPTATAAEERVAYTPRMTATLVAPVKALVDNAYVGAVKNSSSFNRAGNFTPGTVTGNRNGAPASLAGAEFFHADDSNTYNAAYTYNLPEELRVPRAKGDLSFFASVTLTNDRHGNFWRHWDKKTAYPNVYFVGNDTRSLFYSSSANDCDGTWTYGGPGERSAISYSYIKFYARAQVCTCGSSRVNQVKLVLVDEAGPKVSSITTSKTLDGSAVTEFKPGDTVYIHLNFDEDIRFSDMTAPLLSSAPKLKFRVKRIVDGIEESGIQATAALVSLKNNTLSFVYTVPAVYGAGIAVNHYIDEVYPYAQQTTFVGGPFALSLPGVSVALAPETKKSTSYITDIAGNAMQTTGTVKLAKPAYLDNVAPVVEKIELTHPVKNKYNVSEPCVWAGIGDQLGFSVYFSETLGFLSGGASRLPANSVIVSGETRYNLITPFPGVETAIWAELNLGVSGTPVKARADYMVVRQDGLNGKNISIVHFQPTAPITADMAPLVYGGAPLPVGLNKIYQQDSASWKLSDLHVNLYNGARELINTQNRVMPAGQRYPDTLPPAATTTLGQTAGGYLPGDYGAHSIKEFFFPLTLTDGTAQGAEFASGIRGQKGLFLWEDTIPGAETYSYLYAVTGSIAKPADTAYKEARSGERIPFEQLASTALTGTSYLHIKLADGAACNLFATRLVVTAVDLAGNTAETAFPLDYIHDIAGPATMLVSSRREYRKPDGLSPFMGFLTADLTVKDPGGLVTGATRYQWVTRTSDSVAADPGGWQTVTAFTTDTATEKAFALVKPDLAAGTNHKFRLFILSQDTRGNVSETFFDLDYNLALPTYNLDFVTDPLVPDNQHSLKVSLPNPPDANSGRLLVLVKKPETFYTTNPNGDEYFAFLGAANYAAQGASDAMIIDNPFDLFIVDLEAFPALWNCWRNVRMSWSGTTRVLTELTREQTFYAGLQESLYLDYHELEVTFIALPGNADFFNIPESVLQTNDVYTYRVAGGWGHTEPPNSISIGNPKTAEGLPENKDGGPLAMGYDESFDSSQSVFDAKPGRRFVRSLDGASLDIELANTLVPSYGLSDIDFTSLDTRLEVYYRGETYTEESTLIHTQPLLPLARQTFTFPVGLCDKSGMYKVVVTVKSVGSGEISRAEYTDIYLDLNQPSAYGLTFINSYTSLTPVETEWGTYAPRVWHFENQRDFDLGPDERVQEISLSTVPLQSLPEVSEKVTYLNFYWQDLESCFRKSYDEYLYASAYLRVWNETTLAQVPLDAYKWIDNDYGIEIAAVTLDGTNTASVLQRMRDYSGEDFDEGRYPLLPIAPGQPNIVRYQMVTSSGVESPVQTLIIHPQDERPTMTLDIAPNRQNNPDLWAAVDPGVTVSVADFTGRFTREELIFDFRVLGENGGESFGALEEDGEEEDEWIDWQPYREQFRETGSVAIPQNGTYLFMMMDPDQNVTYEVVAIDWIDSRAPALEADVSTGAAGAITGTARVTDDLPDADSRLYLTLDGGQELEIPSLSAADATANPLWRLADTSLSGVYETSTSYDAESKTIAFTLFLPFDTTKAEGALLPHTLTMTAADEAGNRSVVKTFPLTVPNSKPKYTGARLDDGALVADFSRPVQMLSPPQSAGQTVFDTAKTLPVFTNGSYEVRYADIFGAEYTEVIAATAFDGLFLCDVSVSDTAPTNKDVTVTVNAAFNTLVSLDIPDVIPGGTVTKQTGDGGRVTGAVIVMSQNGEIRFTVNADGGGSQTRVVSVQNIDKTPPTATLSYTYTAEVSDTNRTTGDVIVSLVPDEPVQGQNGKSTTHTFTLDDQAPFLFEFVDDAGNAASLTAVCPVTIVAGQTVEADTVPPGYGLRIQRVEGGVTNTVAAFTQEEYEARQTSLTLPWFNGSLYFVFDIFDLNPVTLSAPPTPGVAVKGHTVTVSQNAAFTLILRDARGNETLVPIQVETLDNDPPTGSVAFEALPGFGTRGWLTTQDNAGQPVSVVNTTGVQYDTVKQQYYHDFYYNETFVFLLRDAAGNLGTVRAAVVDLDTTPASATIAWNPFLVDALGNPHRDLLTDIPTNSDVTVLLRFNKQVKDVTATVLEGDPNEVLLTGGDLSATVTFRQDAKIELRFVTLAGTASTRFLEVSGIIDKLPPALTVQKAEAESGYAQQTYTITANEPVFAMDAEGQGKLSARSFTRVFELNGDYTLTFVDRAGNMSSVTIPVSGIDRTAPTVMVDGEPLTKAKIADYKASDDPVIVAMVAEYEARHGTLVHKTTREALTMTVWLDEPGVIQWQNDAYPVVAGEKISITIEQNGFYELTGTDLAGMTTVYRFEVDAIDHIAPRIFFPADTLTVRQGTSVSDFETLSRQGVLITDNLDASMTGKWSLSQSLTAQELDAVGVYEVVYTATDAAGNQADAKRFVRVYDKTRLEVLVGGEKTEPEGTLFVGAATDIVITLGNLPTGPGGTEPYTLTWKHGINTAGQMKTGAADITATGRFTADREGYYTLYLVTQSRNEYITTIYVQR